MKTSNTARWATLACCALLLAGSVQAAGPTGDQYQFSGINFPDTYGPVTLTFDGIAENAGGMSVNERYNDFAGIPGGITTNFGPLTSYENSGDIVEFSFSTLDHQIFSDSPTTPWGFSVEDLEWPMLPGVPAYSVEATSYLYLTSNGTPRAINPTLATALGVVVGPHPFDPSVGQVVFITGQGQDDYPDGVVSVVLEPEDTEDFPAALLQQLFGGSSAVINDVHAGIMIKHVPEPSSMVLGGAALIGLGLLAARRRAA